MESNLKIVREFEALAQKKGCTSGQLALAWVISQGAIPIPGTRSSTRLEENFGATEVKLDEDDVKGIRKLVEDAKPQGARSVASLRGNTSIRLSDTIFSPGYRYSDVHMKMIGK